MSQIIRVFKPSLAIFTAIALYPLLFIAQAIATTSTTVEPHPPAPLSSENRQQTLQIHSELLDEQREITVRTPANYSVGNQDYPVLYVLDADWLFPLVADYIEYLTYWERIPPVIVVGVSNVDRNRDYIPWVDPAFPNTGGGEPFLQFVRQTLKPEIQRRYRTSGDDILLGHSFGGVMTLHALFTNPGMFDAYIALGTSTWVSGRQLFAEAKTYFDKADQQQRFVYMAVAEADGGQTVPAGEELAAMFSERAPESLDWMFEVIPETNHFTAVMPGVHAALDTLYPGWPQVEQLEAHLDGDEPDKIKAWFDDQQDKLGWRFYPQSMDLTLLANRLVTEQKTQSAKALMREVRQRFKARPEVHAMSGYVEAGQGNTRQALKHMRDAVRIGEQGNYFENRVQMYRNLVARLEVALESDRDNTD